MPQPRSPLLEHYRDRLPLIVAPTIIIVGLGWVLRCVLYSQFHSGSFSVFSLAACLALGTIHDVLVSVLALFPLAFCLAVFRWRWLASRWSHYGLLFAVFSGLSFNVFLEYFFFEEFNARFNHIAVDYLLFPEEVFGNIRESYNVGIYVAAALSLGAASTWVYGRIVQVVEFGRLPLLRRIQAAAVVVVAALGSLWLTTAIPVSIGNDRINSEVAQNGWAQLVRAYLTADLDFNAYYRTLSTPDARVRAARVLGFPAPTTEQMACPPGDFRMTKAVGAPAASATRCDVVIVLEESLGSEFVGVLPGTGKKCTPHFDRWSGDGMLVTNLIANGNRTVRGLEGVLASFVPLPGDSIVKRARSEDVATVARVLAERGYQTTFLYGGYGLFDNMKPFMTNNGWQEFVEQPDYPSDAFRTIWGVADEYVFDALLARQVQAKHDSKPFFGTLMSTSNHKPYQVPQGRVPLPTDKKPGRRDAVRYADWCIGRYLDQAKALGLLEHTVVLIVGDHGARVYGSEEIPTPSYRIPALFIAPPEQMRGVRIDRLCSQIDLVPTLLALAGIEAQAPFLGQSLLGLPADGGRAFVQHNRDVGLLVDDALVVLGLQKSVYYYSRSGRDSDTFSRVPELEATPRMRELADDASAVFQTAYEIYQGRNYWLSSSETGRQGTGM